METKRKSAEASLALRELLTKPTRREFMMGMGGAAGTLWLTGCGGGSGPAGSSGAGDISDNKAHRAPGVIVPPAGFKLALTSLKVVGENATAVAADGTFSYDNIGNRPNLITVTDASGKPVLLGYSNPASGKPAEVSAKMTAAALLFYAADAYALSAADQQTAVSLLSADPTVAALASTVADRIAADAVALGNQDSMILAAVVQARTTLRGGSSASSRSQSAQTRALRQTPVAPMPGGVTPRGITREEPGGSKEVVQMLIKPASGQTIQSGIILHPTSDDTALQITNTYRLELLYYIQQTDYNERNPDGSSGASHPLVKEIAEGIFPENWIPATKRVAGLLGGALDVVSDRDHASYQPVDSEPIVLKLNPDTAARSTYHVTVVGPAGVVEGQPKLGKEPYASGRNFMVAWTFFLDAIIPVLSNLMDVQFNPFAHFDQSTLELAETLIHLSLDLPEFREPFEKADFKGMTVVVLSAFVNNTAFRQAFLNQVRNALNNANVALWKDTLVKARYLTKLNAILWVVDKLVAFGDLAAVNHDSAVSNWFEEWDVTLVKPLVLIDPKTKTIGKGGKVRFTASTTGTTGQTLLYVWETGSLLTSLTDNAGQTGTQISTKIGTVDFLTKNTAIGTITVTVTVFSIRVDGNTKLGSAQAQVTIDEKKQIVYGRFFVDETPQTIGEAIAAAIAIPKVDKVNSYSVHCYGFSDSAGSYGTEINRAWTEPNRPSYFEDRGSEFVWRIAGTENVPPENHAEWIGYYSDRFKGMIVEVTVSL
ncbi:MAG: hypothetical protein JWN14_4490 [Chthonomonadales bacterium]|nr:hypothetical protein [Chthonomonadales bacterium]